MIFVTGDTHGDIRRFDDPRLKKLKKGDTLIICGDFGFLWDGSDRERKLIKKLSKKKYNICFIDGTHENFDILESFEVCEWNGGKTHRLADNLRHLMRGQIFTLEDMKIFTMGGGESPDIDIRFDNNSWSRKEIPSREELLEGAENLEKFDNHLDLIITHEPPLKIKGFLALKSKDPMRVTGLNTYFEELGNCCGYDRWFFGSLHVDKFISSTHIAVFQNIIDAKTGKPV